MTKPRFTRFTASASERSETAPLRVACSSIPNWSPTRRIFSKEIADDFWRKHFYEAGPTLVNFALKNKFGPDWFVGLLLTCLNYPQIEFISQAQGRSLEVGSRRSWRTDISRQKTFGCPSRRQSKLVSGRRPGGAMRRTTKTREWPLSSISSIRAFPRVTLLSRLMIACNTSAPRCSPRTNPGGPKSLSRSTASSTLREGMQGGTALAGRASACLCGLCEAGAVPA